MNELVRLALPVIFAYLGLMAMGVVDLLFVGRVGAEAVGAVGVGTSIFSWVMMSGIGLLLGLDYLVAHARGAGDPGRGRRALDQALWLSLAVGVPGTALLVGVSYVLPALGIRDAVAAEAGPYLRVTAPSLLPALLFTSFRQYLQALGEARPAAVLLVFANVLNAALNYVLVPGHFGAPALGAMGSGWATLIARLAMMIAIIVWAARRERGEPDAHVVPRLEVPLARELLRLGLPSAGQTLLEVGVFSLATTLAARLSAVEVAAHQIVLNIASVTFMVPLGVGSATAVCVGRALGAGDRARAARRGTQGLALGVGFMACSCAAFLAFPTTILGLYTDEPAIVSAAAGVLLLAAMFQLFDGAQVVLTGALRGTADTRAPMLANLVGHWLVGLPLGLWLAFGRDLGIRGIWTGLATGLAFVGIALGVRWTRVRGALLRG